MKNTIVTTSDAQGFITRIMLRLNLILKINDSDINETYYILSKSSKIWSDINFFSVRITTIESIRIQCSLENNLYELNNNDKTLIREQIEKFEHNVSEETCRKLASSEFQKIFGIAEVNGRLLSDSLDFIEESMTMGEITYYHNLFYVITEIKDLNRIIGLKTIELIPKNLMEKLSDNKENLHERYESSRLLKLFIDNKFWQKDLFAPLVPKHFQSKKKVGVLFSDLKGFGLLVNEFSSADEAESTRLLIKKYQHIASAHIKLHGGYVVQTAGDAFMAIFSLSDNIENDLERMLEAAIGILSIDEIYVYENEKPVRVKTRIGMNVAEVEEGFTGALDLREYTVFGKDVNVASRLEKKVDDVAVAVQGFRGGLLLNLNTSIDNLSSQEDTRIDNMCSDIIEYSNHLPDTSFKRRLEKLSVEMKDYFVLDNLLDSLTHKIKIFLRKENLESFTIHTSILSTTVKEGSTDCLFIYSVEK